MDDLTRLDVALALLRVIAGVTVAAHGYGKVFSGGRLAGTGAWFDSLGMRPGWLHARLAAFTEIGAGLLFAVGFATPFTAAALVALMVVAARTVHRGKGFFVVGGGWEYNLALATIAVAVSTAGSGALSVDDALGWDGLAGGVALVISAVGGILAGLLHLAVFYRPPVAAGARAAAE